MSLQIRKTKKFWILAAILTTAMLLLVPAIAFAEDIDSGTTDNNVDSPEISVSVSNNIEEPSDPEGSITVLSSTEKVELRTAESYAVLAGSEITNTGTTTIDGDIGIHSGSSITGYDDIVHTGELNVANPAAAQAKIDLQAAYTNAKDRPDATVIPVELGETTLFPGVYTSVEGAEGTFEITGTLTLDAQGNPNNAFIFQMGSTLVTAVESSIALLNGATFCQVFWQVGSSATLGADSHFVGHILAQESITANAGATVDGQLLALTGAVTLESNTIINDPCETIVTAPDGGNGTGTGTGSGTGSVDGVTPLGSETGSDTAGDSDVLSGDIVALPATGGMPLVQVLFALGGVMMTVGGIVLKRKIM